MMNAETARTERVFSTAIANCLVVLGTLAVCLAILEVGLRVTGRYQMSTLGGFLEPGGVSYRMKANATKRIEWPRMSFTVYTDDLGFRYKRPGRRPLGAKPYYAVLGSSEVFGNVSHPARDRRRLSCERSAGSSPRRRDRGLPTRREASARKKRGADPLPDQGSCRLSN